MEKSHKTRLFHRNLSHQSSIQQLSTIYRCKKCNHYNYIYAFHQPQLCYFCGNPFLSQI